MDARLEVYCGGMFAGKSTELQRQGKRQELAGKIVVYLKPGIDTRDGETLWIDSRWKSGERHHGSHGSTRKYDGERHQHHPGFEADVVCIDEIQFFPPFFFIRQVQKLLDLGKVVFVAGLDLDKTGRPFDITKELMVRAEVVKKLTAVCAGVPRGLLGVGRRKQHEDTIAVGNDYKPMCRSCAKHTGSDKIMGLSFTHSNRIHDLEKMVVRVTKLNERLQEQLAGIGLTHASVHGGTAAGRTCPGKRSTTKS